MKTFLLLLAMTAPVDAAPVAVSAKPVEGLVNCLARGGTPLLRDTDILNYKDKSDAAKSGAKRNFTLGLAEAFPDPAQGRLGDEKSHYRDLLERHTYTHLEIQILTTTLAKDGKTGTLDSRIYYLSLGASLYDVTSQQAVGPAGADGRVDTSKAKVTTTATTPAAAKADWEKLAPYLAMLCTSVEA